MANDPNVWERLTLPARSGENEPDDPEQSVSAARRKFWRTVHLLDLVAAPCWLYFLTKALVDWDRALLRAINPDLEWLANFRILGFALLLLILLWVGRKLALLWLAYILFWPLLILGWRIPRTLYKRDQWNYIIGLVHIIWSGFASIRNALTGLVLGGSSLLFLMLPGAWTAWCSFVLAVAFQLWLLVSGVRAGLRPSRFLTKQRNLISRVKPGRISTQQQELEALQPAIESSEKLTAPQTAKFLELAANAVLVNRITFFWAFRVHEYRKSPAIVAYGALSVLWLFAGSLVSTSLANLSLFQIDSANLEVGGEPSNIKFVYYSLTSMTGGETSVMKPVTDFALVFKTAAGLIGVLVILTLFVTVISSFRYARDEREAEETLQALRDTTVRLEREYADTFQVKPEQAVERLIQLEHGFTKWLLYLKQGIPEGFLRNGGR